MKKSIGLVVMSFLVLYSHTQTQSKKIIGTADNTLYRNTFSTLNNGVVVYGDNGSWKHGLVVACGVFTNVQSGILPAPGATMKSTENLTVDNCQSTLCGGSVTILPPTPLNSVGGGYAGAAAANGAEMYHDAVRSIMGDTVLDLAALKALHTSAQPYANPYDLVETDFQMGIVDVDVAQVFGAAATFAGNTNGVETQNFASPLQGANDVETASSAQFHAMKTALRDNDLPLDIGHLHKGVYVINVIDCNGNQYHHKIIKI